ncbi:parallel beta-helix repeat protein [Chitinophaga skermanii]|uniref:Parallel beta-helix repeat protein n=1 Tax=Chitinophaga skermanii TaxID=331697 RepID=A0A327QMN6_9BACT|nr:parallel beta-helix domain-containing protein [Chitinophaga skermanii]RAJ05135.1 parallel beta-helix repeat protein [Chitinophaga skermanii]
MKRIQILQTLVVVAVCSVMVSCKSKPATDPTYTTKLTFGPGEEQKINEAFLSLKDSSVVYLKEGLYRFDNLSIAQLKHIKIQGAGKDKTIFDFSSQTQGGEGLRVTNLKDFNINGITLRDAKGDLLKINKSEDIVIADVSTTWKTADSSNGGYGIYPVMCKNVVIENCYAEGASDAGIYVGQTVGAIVRRSKAYRNVAGCEIENTSQAEVYDNEFWGNTAGFLVFDLPGLSQRGGHVKAYNNHIHDNNERNFAKAGSFGTATGVGNAAPGSGVIILSTSDVAIYKNKIINNNGSSITIASGFFVDPTSGDKINDQYFPISRNISIYENEMKMDTAFPKPIYEHRTGQVIVAIEQALNAMDPARKNARIPHILYDGISTNMLTMQKGINPDSICIRQTESNLFVNADAMRIGTKGWAPNTDVTPFTCK